MGAPVDAAAFHAAYDAVQARLGIAKIEPRSGRHNGPHLLNGWTAYAATSSDPKDRRAVAAWFAKNLRPPNTSTDCGYCGYFNSGCAYGRRLGMEQSSEDHTSALQTLLRISYSLF